MKIRIVGGPGSGKSTLAKQLTLKLNIPSLDTDDLKYPDKTAFINRRTREEKRVLLEDFLSHNSSWIVEGSSTTYWSHVTFQTADKVIVLDLPLWILYARIVKRFLSWNFGFSTGRKETFRGMWRLFSWAKRFHRKNLPDLLSRLKQENISYVVCRCKKDVQNIVKIFSY